MKIAVLLRKTLKKRVIHSRLACEERSYKYDGRVN